MNKFNAMSPRRDCPSDFVSGSDMCRSKIPKTVLINFSIDNCQFLEKLCYAVLVSLCLDYDADKLCNQFGPRSGQMLVTNSFNPDQALQKVWPELGPNCLTL